MPPKTKAPEAEPASNELLLEVDEIRVQIVVRELNADGETVAKHPTAPQVFVNERAFREWAAKPFKFVPQDSPAT